MKKITGFILCTVMLMQLLLMGGSVSGVSGYYTDIPTVDGETSRVVDYIYDGVTRSDFTLGTSSKYSNHGGEQRFSTLEFDPAQDDLYFSVTGGTYIHSRRTNTSAISQYNSAHSSEGKRAIAAANGDLWLMVNNRIFTSGSSQNVTTGYIVPMGFSMYEGEIICTNDLTTLGSYSFGIAADGTAMMGYIITTVKAMNQTTGTSVSVDGINRIPEDDHLIMYTDQGYQTNHSMNDAYEVVIDCGSYTVTPGSVISGKVVAITEPGGTKYNCTEGRIVLTARGDRASDLSSFSVGNSVSITVDIHDNLYSEDERWYTVTDAVSGHFPHVINGIPSTWDSSQAVNYPQTCICIMEDGNVMILTSYGRQISSYSEGLWILEMPTLLTEMGVKDAFMLDGGGSAAMVCENSSGSYELTGKPSDGSERAVINSMILAVGPSKSGIDSTDNLVDVNTYGDVLRESSNTRVTLENGAVSLLATAGANPNIKYDILGNISASSYKYAVIEGVPTETGDGGFTLGVYPSGGRALDTLISGGIKTEFDTNGLWQRQVIDLSSSSAWTGRANYLRLDLFDDSGVGLIGEGITIGNVSLFTSLSAANAFAASDPDYGDATGDGVLNLSDVSLIMKKAAGWTVTLNARADYDCDGDVDLIDATRVLRHAAS